MLRFIPCMPIIHSAKKKMRQDRKRTSHNLGIKTNLKSLIKQSKKTPSSEVFQMLQSALDKAVKTKLIHANKAARIKSRLSKLTEPVKISNKKAAKKRVVRKTSKK